MKKAGMAPNKAQLLQQIPVLCTQLVSCGLEVCLVTLDTEDGSTGLHGSQNGLQFLIQQNVIQRFVAYCEEHVLGEEPGDSGDTVLPRLTVGSSTAENKNEIRSTPGKSSHTVQSPAPSSVSQSEVLSPSSAGDLILPAPSSVSQYNFESPEPGPEKTITSSAGSVDLAVGPAIKMESCEPLNAALDHSYTQESNYQSASAELSDRTPQQLKGENLKLDLDKQNMHKSKICCGDSHTESSDKCPLQTAEPVSSVAMETDDGAELVNIHTKSPDLEKRQEASPMAELDRKLNNVQKSYSCDVCSKPFKKNSNLKRHFMAIHTEGQSFICNNCGKTFQQKKSLQRHELSHDVSFKCSSQGCEKEFNSERTLHKHLSVHEMRQFLCSVCGKVFQKEQNLTSHLRSVHVSEKQFKCDVCDGEFKTKAVLQRHKSIHENIRRHVCPTCGKSFIQLSGLIQHKAMHLDLRPFCCGLCDVSFRKLVSLQLHKVRQCHFSDEEEQEKIAFEECGECQKVFIGKNSCALKRHMRVHTKERPFGCDVCSRRFSDVSNFKNHQKTHSYRRTLKCSVCNKGLLNKRDLTKHMARHDKDTHKKNKVMDGLTVSTETMTVPETLSRSQEMLDTSEVTSNMDNVVPSSASLLSVFAEPSVSFPLCGESAEFYGLGTEQGQGGGTETAGFDESCGAVSAETSGVILDGNKTYVVMMGPDGKTETVEVILTMATPETAL